MTKKAKPAFSNAKFEATGETKTWLNITLHRIRAVSDIAALDIVAGEIGGWIEKDTNLSVSGNAWVSGNARVYGDAQVSGNARVYDDAWVSGNTQVFGNAWVYGNARVYGDAQVSGDAWVYGNARVYGDAWVSKVNLTAVRSDNYTFTIAPTPQGPRVIAGCRYFSFEEARKHWTQTRAGTPLGEETFAILDLLEAQARIHRFMEPVEDTRAQMGEA